VALPVFGHRCRAPCSNRSISPAGRITAANFDISFLVKTRNDKTCPKKKKEQHQKTNHTLKLTISKKRNKHRGIKEFL